MWKCVEVLQRDENRKWCSTWLVLSHEDTDRQFSDWERLFHEFIGRKSANDVMYVRWDTIHSSQLGGRDKFCGTRLVLSQVTLIIRYYTCTSFTERIQPNMTSVVECYTGTCEKRYLRFEWIQSKSKGRYLQLSWPVVCWGRWEAYRCNLFCTKFMPNSRFFEGFWTQDNLCTIEQYTVSNSFWASIQWKGEAFAYNRSSKVSVCQIICSHQIRHVCPIWANQIYCSDPLSYSLCDRL